MIKTHLSRTLLLPCPFFRFRAGVCSPSSPGLSNSVMSTHRRTAIALCYSRASCGPLTYGRLREEREQRWAGGVLAQSSSLPPRLHAVLRTLSHAARTGGPEDMPRSRELLSARSAVHGWQTHHRIPRQALPTEGAGCERRR